jgi:hypothetical protein
MVKELLIVGLLFASPIIRNTVSSTGPGKTPSAPTELSAHYQNINSKHRNAVPAGCYNGVFRFQKMHISRANECSKVCREVVKNVHKRLRTGRSLDSRTKTSGSGNVFRVFRNKCAASDSFKVVLEKSQQLSQEPPQCIIAPPGPPLTTCMCVFHVDVKSIFEAAATSNARSVPDMQKLPVSPPKCDPATFGDWLHDWLHEAQFLGGQKKEHDPSCTAFREKYPERRIEDNEVKMLAPNGKWVPNVGNLVGNEFPEAYDSGHIGSSRDPKRQRTVPDTCPAPSQAQTAWSVDFGQFSGEDTCAAPPVRQSALGIFLADFPQLGQLPPPSIAQDDGNEPSGDPLDELSKIFGSG